MELAAGAPLGASRAREEDETLTSRKRRRVSSSLCVTAQRGSSQVGQELVGDDCCTPPREPESAPSGFTTAKPFIIKTEPVERWLEIEAVYAQASPPAIHLNGQPYIEPLQSSSLTAGHDVPKVHVAADSVSLGTSSADTKLPEGGLASETKVLDSHNAAESINTSADHLPASGQTQASESVDNSLNLDLALLLFAAQDEALWCWTRGVGSSRDVTQSLERFSMLIQGPSVADLYMRLARQRDLHCSFWRYLTPEGTSTRTSSWKNQQDLSCLERFEALHGAWIRCYHDEVFVSQKHQAALARSSILRPSVSSPAPSKGVGHGFLVQPSYPARAAPIRKLASHRTAPVSLLQPFPGDASHFATKPDSPVGQPLASADIKAIQGQIDQTTWQISMTACLPLPSRLQPPSAYAPRGMSQLQAELSKHAKELQRLGAERNRHSNLIEQLHRQLTEQAKQIGLLHIANQHKDNLLNQVSQQLTNQTYFIQYEVEELRNLKARIEAASGESSVALGRFQVADAPPHAQDNITTSSTTS